PFWLRRGAAWRVCARAGRWTVAGRGGLGVRVVVASCSRPKVEAAAAAFGRLLWPHQALQLEAVEAPSGVSAQPRGRQETRLGALNRLKAARSTAAGAAADFCIAFEGGVEADDTGRLVCFAVVCAQYRSPRSKRILRGPRDSMSRLVEHGVPGSLFQNQLLVPSVF
ncbi:unnamed protein product, partial [Prorocentrum cordatum]